MISMTEARNPTKMWSPYDKQALLPTPYHLSKWVLVFSFFLIFTPLPVGGRTIVISVSVCLFASLSVCPLAYLKTQISRFFGTYMYVAMVRSFCEDNAIRHVLPVLWVTSSFHILERMGQYQRRRVSFVELAGGGTGAVRPPSSLVRYLINGLNSSDKTDKK